MEILTRILAEKARSNLFKFHWRCDKINLINLCFADDLMVFCKGEKPSVELIMLGLQEFQALTGLCPSPGKSHVFFSGVDDRVKGEIVEVSRFQVGQLPVRYLGVPLITTKLKSGDCKSLIDRIGKRIQNWNNKSLSYVGRAQLIKSI